MNTQLSKLCAGGLAVALLAMPTHATQTTTDLDHELALLDAVATGLGSTRSWLTGEPEAAASLLRSRGKLVAFAKERIDHHANTDPSGDHKLARILDRRKALQNAITASNEAIARFVADMPKQIGTELDRQAKAVERYLASKSPRPSSFAYIPKTVWETQTRLELLDIAGADRSTVESLRARERAVVDAVRSTLEGLDPLARAKANRAQRDSYDGDDRAALDAAIRAHWTGPTIERILVPKRHWSMTFGADIDPQSGTPRIREVERIDAYVVVRIDDERSRVEPLRLERDHHRAYGELLGRETPGPIRVIESPMWGFDVLTGSIRP